MPILKRSDLKYNDEYSWETIPGDDPTKKGHPEKDLLSRDEGYEVLDFINAFANEMGITDKKVCLDIEEMIKNKVPSKIHSQEKIKEWIKKKLEHLKLVSDANKYL